LARARPSVKIKVCVRRRHENNRHRWFEAQWSLGWAVLLPVLPGLGLVLDEAKIETRERIVF